MVKRLFKQLLRLPQGSTTFTLAGVVIAVGGWVMAHPEVVTAISPGAEGMVLAIVGALVAIARYRGIAKNKVEK